MTDFNYRKAHRDTTSSLRDSQQNLQNLINDMLGLHEDEQKKAQFQETVDSAFSTVENPYNSEGFNDIINEIVVGADLSQEETDVLLETILGQMGLSPEFSPVTAQEQATFKELLTNLLAEYLDANSRGDDEELSASEAREAIDDNSVGRESEENSFDFASLIS